MTTSTQIRGGCHCGNIAYALDWSDERADIPARACGCTFCVKHGGVWTSDPGARLEVVVRDAALVTRYAFATQSAVFHVCARCGVVPVVVSSLDGRDYAVVNVNTFENVDAGRLQRAAASFEGETLESRLARRRRGWIPDVRFVAASG